MKSVHTLLFTLFLLVASSWASEGPDWKIRIEESDLVTFEVPKWHVRDDGWLFTSRVSTVSETKVKRVMHVVFTAYGESEEDELWVYRKTLRRDDFDSKMGGLKENFLRAHLRGIPDEISLLKVEFVNLPKSAVENEDGSDG